MKRAFPRPGPRPARGTPDETAQRLVLAAASLFNDVGYHGTDTNRIARAAGYAPGTFYKHFEDKRAIFLAVYAWWVAHVWSGVEAAFDASRRESRAARARRVAEAVVDAHRAWAGFRADLRYLAARDVVVRRVWLSGRAEQLTRIVALRGDTSRSARDRAGFALLALERVADALADGEATALALDEPRLVDLLAEALA